ncbi:MAG: RDD family protein [Candidatus Bathyarchaeia archaeon]
MSTGSSSQLDMNHWLLRLVAFIIDSIIIGIVAGVIYAILIIFVVLGGGLFFVWGPILLLGFLLGILELFYFMFMDAYYGGTLGKKILGLRVQMVDGSKVTFEKAFIRNISKIYWLFLLIDWLLGIVTPGKDQRQKYTDRIAGTTVVSVKQTVFAATSQPPPPPPPPPP